MNGESIAIIGFILVAIGGIIAMVSRDLTRNIFLYIGFAIMLSGVIVFGIGGCLAHQEAKANREEKIANAITMAENGCKVYLNGIEVDINAVDLEYYGITLKDDIVILTEIR